MKRLSKNEKIALFILTICALELTVFFMFLYVEQIGFWGTHFAGGDDAYITYRTARNIATGQGFGFNPNEPMLVSTAPLYALILSQLYFVSSNLPVVAGLFGLLSTWAGAVFVFLILRKADIHFWPALLGATLYLTSPLLLFLLGMETPVLFALILGAFWAAMDNRRKTAVVLSALATLIRPDALLVGGLILLSRSAPAGVGLRHSSRRLLKRVSTFLVSFPRSRSTPAGVGLRHSSRRLLKRVSTFLVSFLKRELWIRREIPWKSMLLYFAVLLPWLVFAWLYFGSILPTSFSAKVAQGQAGHWNIFLTDPSGMLRPWIPHWNEIAFGLVALSALGLIGYWRKLGLIIAWIVSYSIAYRILAVPGYYWYYAPYFAVAAILAGAGIEFGAKLLSFDWNRGKSFSYSSNAVGVNRLRWAVGLLALALIVFNVVSTIEIYARDWHFRDKSNTRFQGYHAAGEWLAEFTSEDATVGSLEIGIVGYLSDRYIVDLCGLAQPESNEAISRGDYLWFFMERLPDYYLSWLPVEKFCFRPEDFAEFATVLEQQYVPVAVFNSPSGGEPVVIYWRQPEKENL